MELGKKNDCWWHTADIRSRLFPLSQKSLEKKESPIVAVAWISLYFINLKCKCTHYLFKKVNQPMSYQPVIKEVYIITDPCLLQYLPTCFSYCNNFPFFYLPQQDLETCEITIVVMKSREEEMLKLLALVKLQDTLVNYKICVVHMSKIVSRWANSIKAMNQMSSNETHSWV